MRRLLFTTALIALSAQAGFAAPVFQPLTPDSGMIIKNQPPAPATPVAAPASSAPATTNNTSATPAELLAPSPAANAPRSVSRSGEVIDSVGGNAIPALPLETMKENNITYLSGGIGDEEEAQLKSQENSYNLRVLVTGVSGEYLSNLLFVLKDMKGASLVTINDAGPYVYMQVPAGEYHLEVSYAGSGKQMNLKVPAGKAVKTQIRL